MEDIEKRAREILATQCEVDGMPEAAKMVRSGRFNGNAVDGFNTTIRAIISALTIPEGYVIAPKRPTLHMILRGVACKTLENGCSTEIYQSMLAARPRFK